MNGSIHFDGSDDEWNNVLSHKPWSLYIYGGDRALEAEVRCKEAHKHVTSLKKIVSIGVARSNPDVHAHFSLTCGSHEAIEVSWSQLADSINKCLKKNNVKHSHIIFDITSLELDTILYLLPQLVKLQPASIFGLYLVPEDYVMKGHGLILQDIQQPRGYVSFEPGLTGARKAQHYIITGFDDGRAQRFIDKYDWGLEQLHGVIGKPSYVDKGYNHAWNANHGWLEPLKQKFPNQFHEIEAAGPIKVRDFFRKQFDLYGMLDIVPLGPKPMLLGVLLFYLGLSEKNRECVRILFDFPTPIPNSTAGIDKGYLFNCNGLLKEDE